MNKVTCPECEGRKGSEVFACGPNHHFEPMYMLCHFCKGGGVVTREQITQLERSKVLRQARMDKNYSTREVAVKAKMKFTDWNDLEHGRASLCEIEAAIDFINTLPVWSL